MSYQVLARKWRPNSFSDVVGQEHVLTILSNALSLGRIHHAYLFSGTRGVGKTSIARLLAKCLNCETGVTATPCGKCDNCRDIEQGRFVDLLEIDAASRTKVEDTREILDNIQYLPTKGRFKIYLIDEVHMLSRSSFNALLKTLEEPPEHVKFLLATTDPQKLPITILSRCLHLHLNVLDTTLINNQLMHILESEQISSEPKAVQLLAKAANGSMRDALSLTDQAIALGNGQVGTSSVTTMLGTLDRRVPFALVEALYRGEGSALMQQLEAAAMQGVDWDSLLSETIVLLHQIALLQIVPTAVGDYGDSEEQIQFLAKNIAPNDLQLFYQILLMGRKELAFAPDKKMGVEMSFLRALAFLPKPVTESTPPQSIPQSDPESTKHAVNQSATKSILATESTKSTKSTEKKSTPTVAQNVATTEAESLESAPSTTVNSLPDEVPISTKNILAMREQLIKEEQKRKKSETVAKTHQASTLQPTFKNDISNKNNISNKNDISNKSDKSNKSVNSDLAVEGRDIDDCEEEMTAENYQWQAKTVIETKDEIDTKAFIASLTGDKTAEMTQKLIAEMASKDAWCGEIEKLSVPPLVKQIAVNSFVEQIDETELVLHMRSSVHYLTNSPDNLKKLEQALAKVRNRPIKLSVVIDDSLDHKTPIEQREALYQEKLKAAKTEIHQDEKVALICQFFEAQIDEESIRPV
ncbi:DNA polymerase III subunit gamma/tau [Orbaceae bacterium ESL0721]|nr:DNA polymerase III subunit gamma/tau [Orbaceae bacterium ESL0721]